MLSGNDQQWWGKAQSCRMCICTLLPLHLVKICTYFLFWNVFFSYTSTRQKSCFFLTQLTARINLHTVQVNHNLKISCMREYLKTLHSLPSCLPSLKAETPYLKKQLQAVWTRSLLVKQIFTRHWKTVRSAPIHGNYLKTLTRRKIEVLPFYKSSSIKLNYCCKTTLGSFHVKQKKLHVILFLPGESLTLFFCSVTEKGILFLSLAFQKTLWCLVATAPRLPAHAQTRRSTERSPKGSLTQFRLKGKSFAT